MFIRSLKVLLLIAVVCPTQSLVAGGRPGYQKPCPPICPPPCPPKHSKECPPPPSPKAEMIPESAKSEDAKSDADAPQVLPGDDAAPIANDVPFQPNPAPIQTAQGPSVQSTTAPNMIGDFLSPGFGVLTPALGPFSPTYDSVPSAGATRLQIGQNNSPLPRDRYAVTYNHFHNAYLIQGEDAHLDLYTMQFEKTFACGDASIEFRLPFYSAPDNTQTLEGAGVDTDGYSMELGDLSIILKKVLYRDCCTGTVMTAGMGFTAPTGADARVNDGAGASGVVRNQSIELTPYFAVLRQPTDRLFTQFFAQADFSLNGNDVYYTDGAAVATGDLNDQHLLKLDYQIGYWLRKPGCGYGNGCCFDDPCGCCDDWCTDSCCGGDCDTSLIRGVASIFELHYTTTMNDADIIAVPGGSQFGNTYNRVDVLNLTAGTTFLIGKNSTLTGAITLPVNEIADGTHLFDHEFAIQFNRYF